jgi:hypothetical protein
MRCSAVEASACLIQTSSALRQAVCLPALSTAGNFSSGYFHQHSPFCEPHQKQFKLFPTSPYLKRCERQQMVDKVAEVYEVLNIESDKRGLR